MLSSGTPADCRGVWFRGRAGIVGDLFVVDFPCGGNDEELEKILMAVSLVDGVLLIEVIVQEDVKVEGVSGVACADVGSCEEGMSASTVDRYKYGIISSNPHWQRQSTYAAIPVDYG